MQVDWPRLFGQKPQVMAPYTTPAWGLRRLIPAAVAIPLAFFCLVFGFFYALTTPYLFLVFAAPLGLLALIAIWALPDLRTAPTRSMENLYFAFFLCLILWPNYLAIALPGLPWITLLRLTGIPMVLLLLVAVSSSREFRRDLAETLNAAPAVWKLLAAFVVIQLLTIGLSGNPQQSLQKFIVAQTNWTAIFFVSCYVFRRIGRIRQYLFVLWAMAMIICALGVWEASVQKVLWAGHVPSFLKIDDAEGLLNSVTRAGSQAYRAKVTFSTPLGLAEFLALMTPFVLHFIAGPFRLPVRIAAAISLPIMFHVVLATDSRLGTVGMFLAALLYIASWGVMRWIRDRAGLIGPAVVMAYPMFFAAFVALTFVWRRLEVMVWGGGAQQGSNDARQAQVERGLPLIAKNPLGYGAGEGGDVLGFKTGGFQTIDNYYLAIALEYGVIGFVLYYGLLLFMMYLSARAVLLTPKDTDPEQDFIVPLAIALAVFFVVKLVFSQQDNHPLIYMMMGMLMALFLRIKKSGSSDAAPTPTRNHSVATKQKVGK